MNWKPRELIKSLPHVRRVGNKSPGKTIVPVKLFAPSAGLTWYLIAKCSGKDLGGYDIIYGYVAGSDSELGCFSLHELENLVCPFDFRIERDRNWNPTTTLAEVVNGKVR